MPVKGLIQRFLSVFADESAVTKPTPVCPNCRKQLGSISDGLMIFSCFSCQGVWLSQEAFSRILVVEEQKIAPLLDQKPIYEHTFQRSPGGRICPSCDTVMENYEFDYSSGIWIDACPHRHGIWLDSGEIHLIRRFRQSIDREFTLEEKLKISNAFLDGATTTMKNLNKINRDIRREYAARHYNHRYGDPNYRKDESPPFGESFFH